MVNIESGKTDFLFREDSLDGERIRRDGIKMDVSLTIVSEKFGIIEIDPETLGFQGNTSKVIPIISPHRQKAALFIPSGPEENRKQRFTKSLEVYRYIKPVIAPILYDFGDDNSWYITEFLEGKPMSSISVDDFREAGYDIVSIFDKRVRYISLSALRSIALGLIKLHENGLIYGDYFDFNTMIKIPPPNHIKRISATRIFDMSNVQQAGEHLPLSIDIMRLSSLITEEKFSNGTTNFIWASIPDKMINDARRFARALSDNPKEYWQYEYITSFFELISPYLEEVSGNVD